MSQVRSKKAVADSIRELVEEADSLGLVRVTPEQLLDWAEAIDPQGFLITGLEAHGLVKLLSEKGVLSQVLEAACALYGMHLKVTDQYTLTLERTPEHAFGFHVGAMLSQAKVQHDKWYNYNATCKFTKDGVQIAMEGLQESHQ